MKRVRRLDYLGEILIPGRLDSSGNVAAPVAGEEVLEIPREALLEIVIAKYEGDHVKVARLRHDGIAKLRASRHDAPTPLTNIRREDSNVQTDHDQLVAHIHRIIPTVRLDSDEPDRALAFRLWTGMGRSLNDVSRDVRFRDESDAYVIQRALATADNFQRADAKRDLQVQQPGAGGRQDMQVEDNYVWRPPSRASPYVPPGGFAPGAERKDAAPEYSGSASNPIDATALAAQQSGGFPNTETDADLEARRRMQYAMSEAATNIADQMRMNGSTMPFPPQAAVVQEAQRIVAAGGPAGYMSAATIKSFGRPR